MNDVPGAESINGALRVNVTERIRRRSRLWRRKIHKIWKYTDFINDDNKSKWARSTIMGLHLKSLWANDEAKETDNFNE